MAEIFRQQCFRKTYPKNVELTPALAGFLGTAGFAL
jgi:hypothetical protein